VLRSVLLETVNPQLLGPCCYFCTSKGFYKICISDNLEGRVQCMLLREVCSSESGEDEGDEHSEDEQDAIGSIGENSVCR